MFIHEYQLHTEIPFYISELFSKTQCKLVCTVMSHYIIFFCNKVQYVCNIIKSKLYRFCIKNIQSFLKWKHSAGVFEINVTK